MVSKRALLKKAKEIAEKKVVKKGEEVEIKFPNVKLFNKYDSTEVVVSDPGLKRYINLKPVILPKSQGRFQRVKFWKSKMHIVERLMNHIPVSGHKGKKHYWSSGDQLGQGYTLVKIIQNTLELIKKKTSQNPIQVIVKAVENASPREEITTVTYGGVRHPKAVDSAPQRRIDLAMRWMTQSAFQKSNKSKKNIWATLAEEVILASNNDKQSFAVNKKFETERQAAASR